MEITFKGKKQVIAFHKGFTIETDQPVKQGGEELAPSPFDLFLASIGTCSGVYVQSFCDQRNIPTDNIKLIQTMEFDSEKKMIGKINIEIQTPDDFPEKYKSSLIKVAGLCAVKKHLADSPEINIITS